MKNIITAVIAIVCIVAGGVGGHFLKSMSSGSSEPKSHAEKPADEGHGAKAEEQGEKKDDHAKKPEKKDGHGGGDEASTSSDVVYYKFTREFVVPIIREGRVQSLVILNLN